MIPLTVVVRSWLVVRVTNRMGMVDEHPPVAKILRVSYRRVGFMQMTRDEFEHCVDLALEQIPASFAPHLTNVVIEVEDMPSPSACESVGVRNPKNLLGLYQGVPMTRRSVEHNARMPDRILIYQANIQRICRTREALVEQIRKTVLHEVGHHFGLSEEDLEKLGYG